MAINNAVNASTAGVQCLTSTGVWNGRTITAGSGITVTNGDGVSGNPTIAASGSGILDPTTTMYVYDDFLAATDDGRSTCISSIGWIIVNQGGVSSEAGYTSTSNNPGIVSISANANSPTSMGLIQGPYRSPVGGSTNITLGGGVLTYTTYLRLSQISATGQVYVCRFGLGDCATGSTESSNGVYFTCTSTVNSNQWVGVTANGGSRTSVNSSVTATTNYTKFSFVVNAAASSVEFFINGASIGTSSTNIPTGQIGMYYQMNQVSGADFKFLYIDYVTLKIDLTNSR